MNLSVVTFNIRLDCAEDGANGFPHRKELIRRTIKQRQPDIIAFQEVLPHVFEWLQTTLTDYIVLGGGRDADQSDEHMVIACRRDKFSVIGLSTVWLSPTPQIPGSRFEDQSMCPRICCTALLRPFGSKRLLRVYATHLDHESDFARREGLRQLFAQIRHDRETSNLPAILLGDFNDVPESLRLDVLAAESGSSLVDVTADSGYTFHDYGRASVLEKIDYILATADFVPAGLHRWEDRDGGLYLSDHYPVEADLQWEID